MLIVFLWSFFPDFNFSMYPPSMIAAASLISAINDLLKSFKNHFVVYRSISSQILYQLHELTGIEKVNMNSNFIFFPIHLSSYFSCILIILNQSVVFDNIVQTFKTCFYDPIFFQSWFEFFKWNQWTNQKKKNCRNTLWSLNNFVLKKWNIHFPF